jgi:hypothetical protein
MIKYIVSAKLQAIKMSKSVNYENCRENLDFGEFEGEGGFASTYHLIQNCIFS